MNEPNSAFTGFFNNVHKRIDLVLVIAGRAGSELEEIRINYLKTIIKCGLELELDQGKMLAHRTLIFVKIHAPDDVIEEYGPYFDVRKFFKDSHADLIKPFWSPPRIKNERELIKLIRKQYPGPGNYSTLERSKIVYNIIQRLPFGKREELFGISQLQQHNVIIDAFALHDGPYFLTQGQNYSINARQTLFYNWVGASNIWKAQPIHIIQEYLGERIAMYFAYYEYFNFILLFLAILGFLIAVINYYGPSPKHDVLSRHICLKNLQVLQGAVICPQCRYFDLCPFRIISSYCREMKFLTRMDTSYAHMFAYFIPIWGVLFIVLWRRKQNYLKWMWEINEKCAKQIINSDYYTLRQFYKSNLTAATLEKVAAKAIYKWGIIVFVSVALFGVWLFGMFILSTQIWYIKHWLDKIYNRKNSSEHIYDDRLENEYLFIGIEAGVYSILTTVPKKVARILSHRLTQLENNKSVSSYSCSLAIKLYGFYFTGTFALLILQIFIGNIFYTYLLDRNNWYSISGFKVMNNGIGSSLDDMCIILAVAIMVEQIIMKIPSYVLGKRMYSKSAPIWEREYHLETVKDEYFHYAYNDIAIQFAMVTFFSFTFPPAPLLVLLINLWDIRHKGKKLLVSYRRPLLLDTSGPAIWHNINSFTAFLVPIFRACMIALHSRYLLINHPLRGSARYHDYSEPMSYLGKSNIQTFEVFTGTGSAAEELKKIKNIEQVTSCYNPVFNHWWFKNDTFVIQYKTAHYVYYKYQYILLYSFIGVLINLFIHLKFPTRSSVVEDAKNTEWKIKQKYYIRKGFRPNVE